jgi:hypothetical protein
MAKRSSLKKANIMSLKVDRLVNFRDDYDVPSMKEEILQAGRILEPLHVIDGSNILLKGNRRTLAAQELYSDPSCPADVKEALEKVDVFYYSDLNEKEITEIVLDHGSQKGLTRVEVLKAVWRLQKQMYSERDIIIMLYQQLAHYTGKTKKAAEAQNLAAGEAREKFLKTWLHGTVGDYMMPGGQMGEFVREQFILTDRAQDRELTEAEKAAWTLEVTRDRVKELRTAKNKDKETTGWDPEKGGELFNAKVQEFIAEDAAPKGPRKAGFTSAQMETTADAMQSGFRLAFMKCAGKLPESDNAKLEALDTEYFRRDKVLAVLNANADRIGDKNVQALVKAILAGTDGSVTEYLQPFLIAAE